MLAYIPSLVLEVSFKFAAIGERMTKELKALHNKPQGRDGDGFFMHALGFLMLRFQLDVYLFACTDNDESGRHITFRLPFTMKQIRKHVEMLVVEADLVPKLT